MRDIMGHRKSTAAGAAASILVLLSAPASSSQNEQVALPHAGEEHTPILRHDPLAFQEQPHLTLEACMRDVYRDPEALEGAAAIEGARARDNATAFAALMRNTSRAAPRAALQQLECAVPPRSMTIADLNRNGHLDLIAATTGAGVSYYLNDGTGRFTKHRYAAVDMISEGASGLLDSIREGLEGFLEYDVYACDLTGDGHMEIVTIPAGSGHEAAIMVHSTGSGWPDTTVRLTKKQANLGLLGGFACADIDGDGHSDIVYTLRANPGIGGDQQPIRVLLGDGRGGLEEAGAQWTADATRESPTWPAGGNWQWNVLPFQPLLIDLTGNGYLDMLVTADFGNPLLYHNTGTSFERRPTPLPGHYSTMGAVAVDVDGDGNMEIIVTDIDLRRMSTCPWAASCDESSQQPGGSTIMKNENGTLREYKEHPLAAKLSGTGWGWGIATADLDGDGRWDIVQASGNLRTEPETSMTWSYRSQPPAVLMGEAEGHADSTREWQHIWNTPNPTFAVVAADMTGNGVPDLILRGEGMAEPQLYVNRSDPGRFASIHVERPATVTLRRDSRSEETFRLPDRHSTMGSVVDGPWHFGVAEGEKVRVTVTFDSGSTREVTVEGGTHLRIGP